MQVRSSAQVPAVGMDIRLGYAAAGIDCHWGVSLPDTAAILYRPVRIAEIVACVRELLARDNAT